MPRPTPAQQRARENNYTLFQIKGARAALHRCGMNRHLPPELREELHALDRRIRQTEDKIRDSFKKKD